MNIVPAPERIIARRAASLGSSIAHVRRDLRAVRIAVTVLVVIAVLVLGAAMARICRDVQYKV